MRTRTTLLAFMMVALPAALWAQASRPAQTGGFVATINPNLVGTIPGTVSSNVPLHAGAPLPQYHPIRPVMPPYGAPHVSPYIPPYLPSYWGPTVPLPPGISVTTPRHFRPGLGSVWVGPYISVTQPAGNRLPVYPDPAYTVLVPVAPQQQASFPVSVGMPRSDVILHLGTPLSSILSPGRETLVFSNTTIVIANGVVAVIQ